MGERFETETMKKFVFLRALMLTVAGLISVVAHAQTITSFENPSDFSTPSVYPNLSTVTAATTGVTDGVQSAKITFQATTVKSYPALNIYNLSNYSFAASGGLAIDISNPGSSDLTFSISLVDATGNSMEYPTTLESGGFATYHVGDPQSSSGTGYGLFQLPNPLPGSRDITGFRTGTVDFANISRIAIFVRGPNPTSVLYVDNVRLIPRYSITDLLAGMVDPYGQYAKSTWPGKLNSETEFPARIAAEAQDLVAHPQLSSLSKYGGSLSLATKTATGYFRTLLYNGKWWLVDPAGYRFLSMGINAVALDSSLTTGREQLYSWLPALPDPLSTAPPTYLANHYIPTSTAYGNRSGWTYDFYGANLERKYGSDYLNKWKANSLSRITSWGFNTVGGWSPSFVANGRVPYTITIGTEKTPNKIDAGYGHGSLVPDAYDPKFASVLAAALQVYITRVKSDPYLIGYFVDNELSWIGQGPNAQYGLAYGVMKQPSTLPAKKIFYNTIAYKYATIDAVNAAWGTTFPTLASLAGPTILPANPNAALAADMDGFISKFALQYFNTVRAQIRKLDVNHLYLGCRFGGQSPTIVAAAAKYADVISLNIYTDTLDSAKWGFLSQYNRPCLVSEFHFGATDRGMAFGGISPRFTQQLRALAYQNYVRSVADNSIFVGCHWYQYVDQPTAGRQFDGENGGIGLVDASDTPIPELITQCRQTNAEVYGRHGP